MAIASTDLEQVAALLGRHPRGLEDIAVRDAAGAPAVLRVASLVDGKPFPTLFWLVDPALCYRIDTLEAGGLIAQLQGRVDADAQLRAAMRRDHLDHIRLRERYMSDAVRARLHATGGAAALSRRGIGGIADFARIRCLHTWYAAHLVVPNTIGALLERHWDSGPRREEAPAP